jgi:hypothetical protein
MRTIVAVAMLIAFTVSMVYGLQDPIQGTTVKGTSALYELYSWPDAKVDTWNFSVLYNTSRQKAVSEVFDKKTELKGLDQLKSRISKLAPGSKIMWLGELTTFDGHKVKGSERLAYPPDAAVRDIKQFAASQQIEILGPFKSPTR